MKTTNLIATNYGGEEIPPGGWRGGEEIPPGGWRGGEEIPPGGWRYVEDVYRTLDGKDFFKFRFYPNGDNYEIDILQMPNYGSRPCNLVDTCRLPSDRGVQKIDIPNELAVKVDIKQLVLVPILNVNSFFSFCFVSWLVHCNKAL